MRPKVHICIISPLNVQICTKYITTHYSTTSRAIPPIPITIIDYYYT